MFNFKIKYGSRRIIFIFKNKVYKIPNFTRWVSFIRGIEENLEERYWWSCDGSRKREPNRLWNYNLPLAEIFYADRFGFLVIMEKLDTSFMADHYSVKLEYKDKLEKDIEKLKEEYKSNSFTIDIKPSNVGYRNNRLLFLDYGYFGGTMDCYIGT